MFSYILEDIGVAEEETPKAKEETPKTRNLMIPNPSRTTDHGSWVVGQGAGFILR